MNALVQSSARAMLEPRTFEEAMRFASMLAKSSMVPRDFQNKPENVLVAVQWGREIGLGPLQALQNIAVINGRPSVWGDAMLALVRGSGMCAMFSETMEGEGDARRAICRTRRRDSQDITEGAFSVDDAKRAGLWGKSGPWQQYPDRMLKLRARGFALRDAFPDVLRGVISAEEAQDMPADTKPAVTDTSPVIDAAPEPPPQRPAFGTVAEAKTWCAEHGEKMTGALYLEAIGAEFSIARTNEEVDALVARQDVQAALDNDRLRGPMDVIVKAALERTAEEVA